MLQAKLYYLKQLENGPQSHRTITKRMSGKFLESAAKIKDDLVAEGLIVLTKKVLQDGGRYAYFYKRTQKDFVVEEPQKVAPTWEDGTTKSTGNAFDWRGPCNMFSKQELANMHQKYKNNNPITIYSRA